MRWLISIPLLFLLSGCADFGYYWNNARGHLAVMDKRVDIDDLLADDGIEPGLRERLALVQEIRRFSVTRLGLPENDSYLSYVQLDRPYVVQNLFAAPEFSTRLQRWCYPIIGCASYRGYYDEQRLLAYVGELKADGLEVYVGQVPAYSTLGWFDDPVLSSFVYWPDYRLAGLIFHELTHQQIYIDDDTTFNESLASAVQRVGTELWLQSRERVEELGRLSRWLAYRGEVVALIEATREQLAGIYQRDIADHRKRALKTAAFAAAREAHTLVAEKHGITGGFTAWFADELNNAKISSVTAYNDAVPAFVNMIRAHDLDFAAFFDYAAAVGKLDKQQRDNCLLAWKQGSVPAGGVCPGTGRGEATAS
ncbi:MAG: aminopeptidase [Gammaproteobacteria bacterium]|nr:aminopeptidase [Gammaproteobacteria bacterium]MDH3535768.1 aminopeptidase [Gammaproteobacteria bacterium]